MKKGKIMAKKYYESTGIGKKYDYTSMFEYYCQSINGRIVSYRDVARKFNVSSHRVIENIGVKNDWVRKRQSMWDKRLERFKAEKEKMAVETEQKAFENLRLLEKTVVHAIEMLNKTQSDVDMMSDAIADQPDTLEGSNKRLELLKEQLIMSRSLGSQADQLKDLSDALKTAQNQQRIILGMPTEISKADINNTNRNVVMTNDDITDMDNFIKKNNNATDPATN